MSEEQPARSTGSDDSGVAPVRSATLPIVTARLRLRPFAMTDCNEVHRYASDPEVTRYLSWGPNTVAETREFVAGAIERAADPAGTDVELVIIDSARGEVVGGCGLLCRRPQYREYEMGYCLRKSVWGCGIATEATRALAAFGFSTLDAHRIFGLVDGENPGSGRVLETLGFQREGLLRRDSLKDGVWRDTLIYGMLQDEWSKRT